MSGLLARLHDRWPRWVPQASAKEGCGQIGGSFLMVPGVMSGAAFWYSLVCSGALLLRRSLASAVTRHLNLGAGVALIGFGLIIGLG